MNIVNGSVRELEKRGREEEKRERGSLYYLIYLTVTLNFLCSQGEDRGWKLEEREPRGKQRSLEGHKEADQGDTEGVPKEREF